MRSLARVEGEGLLFNVVIPDYFELPTAVVMSTSAGIGQRLYCFQWMLVELANSNSWLTMLLVYTKPAARSLAGIFAGVSSGGAISAALRLSATVENATIVAIVCDRGDRCAAFCLGASLMKAVSSAALCCVTTRLHSHSLRVSMTNLFPAAMAATTPRSVLLEEGSASVAAARHTLPRADSDILAEALLAYTLRYLSTGVFSEATAARDPGPCTVEEFPSAAARLLFFPAPHLVVFRADDDPNTGAWPCSAAGNGMPRDAGFGNAALLLWP